MMPTQGFLIFSSRLLLCQASAIVVIVLVEILPTQVLMRYIVLFFIYTTSKMYFLIICLYAIYLFELLSWPRRRERIRSARLQGAFFLRDHLLRHGDQEARRSAEIYIVTSK